MIIDKILNNNVVVITEGNKETIVMGRGIAYKKKIGDSIDPASIDKEFYLKNPETNNRFQELIVDMPMHYLELGEEIVKYIKTKLGVRLDDSIYIALVDHIYMAVKRYKEGIVVKNALLWDIRRFYPYEFEVGKMVLDKINERTNTKLPIDEAGFIALHIVNSQLDEKVEDIYEVTKVMQEVTNIVKYFFHVEFDEESVYFYRFITHLKFFSQRLLNGTTYQDEEEDDLLDVIKLKYKNSFNCVLKINDFIRKKYNYIVSKEEQLYLTIHIERVIYKADKG